MKTIACTDCGHHFIHQFVQLQGIRAMKIFTVGLTVNAGGDTFDAYYAFIEAIFHGDNCLHEIA